MSSTLRYKTSEAKYARAREKGLLIDLRYETPIKDFRYFKIVASAYPHDRVASIHHLLVPRRKFAHWSKMNRRERKEFKVIDAYLGSNYDCIKLNYPSKITVPDLVHWHLYIYK